MMKKETNNRNFWFKKKVENSFFKNKCGNGVKQFIRTRFQSRPKECIAKAIVPTFRLNYNLLYLFEKKKQQKITNLQ